MISRHWKGIARPERAAEYVRHLRTSVFPELARIPGFVRGTVLSRSVEAGTEFQIVTQWTTLDAIKAFAGAGVETAVVAPVVQELMVSYDATVVHYEILDVFEPQGS
jgi:heme-degrading monooxygenase HmoA